MVSRRGAGSTSVPVSAAEINNPPNDGFGSGSDFTDSPAIGPLISEKQKKTMRKRTCRLECPLSGVERSYRRRGPNYRF